MRTVLLFKEHHSIIIPRMQGLLDIHQKIIQHTSKGIIEQISHDTVHALQDVEYPSKVSL